MAFLHRNRLINPRLGTYFSIFTSIFVGAVLLGLMIAELGFDPRLATGLVVGLPLLAVLAMGVGSRTDILADYFAAGRRVPAFFAGLVGAVGTLGAMGFIAFPGVLLIVGVDAFALIYGWIVGLVLAGVLIAPFLRKAGAFTVASFFYDRFSNRPLRIAVAAMVAVPLVAVLAAEARLATSVAHAVLGLQPALALGLIIGLPAVLVGLGGMRSVMWSSAAMAIVAVLAVLLTATVAALMLSTLPLPQITHGGVVREIAQKEALRTVVGLMATPLSIDWPGVGEELITKRYLQPFGAIGWLAFPLTVLMLAAGLAAMPHGLNRHGTTPAVYEARKAHGWAVVVAAFVLLTLAGGVALLRGMMIDQIVGQPLARAPQWFSGLRDMGLITIRPTASPVIDLAQIGIYRDRALVGLAAAAGLPRGLILVTALGAIFAAMVAIASALQALAATLSEDIIHGLARALPTDKARVATARITAGASGVLAFAVAALPADPLQIMLAAATLSASTLFPVIVLSILWRRMTSWGALLGLMVGFGLAVMGLVVAETGLLALPAPLPAVIALPASVVATILGSYLTRAGSRGDLELLRDMRVPGGETIRDRTARHTRAKDLGR